MIARYPVLNLRLGQAGQPMISTRDFNGFFSFALDQANRLASIARAHELSAEEENEVRRAVGGIEQYTVPQTACPAGAPETCPAFPPSAPAVGGIPWWAAAVAGLGVGAAVVGFLA